MIVKTLYMLKADEGKILFKDGIYTPSVLLKEGETEEGWDEVDIEKYNLYLKEKELEDKVIMNQLSNIE